MLRPRRPQLDDDDEEEGDRQQLIVPLTDMSEHDAIAALDSLPLISAEGISSVDEHTTAAPCNSPTLVVSAGGVSSRTCAINIIKCAIGAGSFNVPYAFLQEGLWGGVFGTLVMGALAAYTIILLARAEKHVVQLCGGPTQLRFTYPEVARALCPAFTVGRGINVVEVTVYVGMVLLSVGVCAIYAVFILATLPGVLGIARSYVAILCGGLLLALALVRTYAWLAVTSILGDIAVAAGLIATVAYGLNSATPSLSHGARLLNMPGVPQATSTIAFLFLIHVIGVAVLTWVAVCVLLAVVLPMAQSLAGDLGHPNKFERIVTRSMALITAVNLVFGTLCVLIYGKDTKQNIIDNLGKSTVVKIVSVLLCVDLLFTVPMVLAFGREVLEKSLFESTLGRQLRGRRAVLASCALRAVLVGAVMVIALTVMAAQGGLRAFGSLINLVGGVVSCLLGLILPPALYVQSLRLQHRLTRLHGCVLGGVVMVGLAILVSSTYYTVEGFRA